MSVRLRYEQTRLNTFASWPKNHIVRAERLAKAGNWYAFSSIVASPFILFPGFYYTGTLDKVTCIYCRGSMQDWQPGDDAFTEHRRHFGTRCRFIRGEITSNVPIPEAPIAVVQAQAASTEPPIDRQTEQLRQEIQELNRQKACKVCLDNPIEIILIPCRHVIACKSCAERVSSCPICRSEIGTRLEIYFS